MRAGHSATAGGACSRHSWDKRLDVADILETQPAVVQMMHFQRGIAVAAALALPPNRTFIVLTGVAACLISPEPMHFPFGTATNVPR